ncbi:MAG: hypothetical protein K2H73_08640 [Treponemataceae bacterium]|nr:hypothetical protein [Treponemataceae bacterium]
MKNKLCSLCIASAVLCFTGCSEPELAREQTFEYVVELNILNESSAAKTVMAEAYMLYDDYAEKLYDCTPLSVPANNSCEYVRTIANALCAPPRLSHILKIGETYFVGFDRNVNLQIDTAKSNLGSVDWSESESPVISYEDKRFIAKENAAIKLVYEVIIKNEADIPETEKGDYSDGIKIAISHVLSEKTMFAHQKKEIR